MEIILARHGKPKLKHWAWITPRQMKDWIQLYNQAELLVEDVPLDTLKKATESGVIVSSTLRRCVQYAQQLIRDRALLTEELFCEADMPHMLWRFPKLPLSIWGIVFRGQKGDAQKNKILHAIYQDELLRNIGKI